MDAFEKNRIENCDKFCDKLRLIKILAGVPKDEIVRVVKSYKSYNPNFRADTIYRIVYSDMWNTVNEI